MTFRRLSVAMASVLLFIAGSKAALPDTPADIQPVSVSEDYYKSITFSWTDSGGAVHISDLTEEATDPNHIVALLREVYVNPAVPGYTYDMAADIIDDGRQEYATVRYEPCTLPPFNMDPDMKIEAPVPGSTALIVEMKEGYGADGSGESDWQKALEAIKSVSLISKQLYIDRSVGSKNVGFLFNVERSLNKFFIITKGSIRPLATGFPPFYNMYEEFSPSNVEPIRNAYADMNAGRQFPVDHNCSTVIGQRHDIIMSPEGESREYPVNLMFYVPDMRFAGETRTKEPGGYMYEYYSFYAEDHQPYFFFNKIDAEVDSEVLIDSELEARVPLSWVSTYKDITQSQVPERFLVYRVVDDVVESEPVPASRIETRQEDTELLEDGSLVRAASHDVEIYVKEDRNPTSRRVWYMVKGRRQGSEFSFVESNVVNAVVPGYTRHETLAITAQGQPGSRYDKERQVNVYDNRIDLTDSPGPGGMRLLAGHIRVRQGDVPGTCFELRRYTDGSDSFHRVAVMEVTAREEDKLWGDSENPKGVHVYDGTIHYPDGVDTEGLPLTARFKSDMDRKNPENDPLMPVIGVDGSGGVLASFADRFEASTDHGDQPRRYTYCIVYEPSVARDADSELNMAVSNEIQVNVPVRNIVAGYVPYTRAEIEADNDPTSLLPLNDPGVVIVTAQNPNISGYEVTDMATGRVVAKALRSPSGIFTRIVVDDNGVEDSELNPPTSPSFSGKLPFRLTSTVNPGDELALTILYNNGNTYGNIRTRQASRPVPEIVYSKMFYKGDQPDGQAGYYADVECKPYRESMTVTPWPALGTVHSYEAQGYNVWSKHNKQEDHVLIRSLSQAAGNPDNDVIGSSYHFGLHHATMEDPVKVDHLVRMYAAVPQEIMVAEDGSEPGYVIGEALADSEIDNTDTIVTGIEGTGVPEGAAIYYDLQGRQVISPVSGIYIRRVGDKTVKVVIP